VSIEAARRIVADAIAAGVFPGAAVEVGSINSLFWSEDLGRLTFDGDAPGVTHDTIYDLASLTKPIATTTVVMDLMGARSLRLDTPVAELFDEWRGRDREQVTIRDLLEHASGLPARLVDQPPATRREFEHDICTIALEYGPRTKSIYSDLGFILLGFLVERVGQASLDRLFERITRLSTVHLEPTDQFNAHATSSEPPLHFAIDDVLAYGVPSAARPWTAPTAAMHEDPRRGRRLVGEVHDNYAAALGGVAGHAGLFGNASGAGAFARAIMTGASVFDPGMVRLFTTKSTVPGSSRALGWDTMLPTSSCGERMSRTAFGHVGFTGTSLWIDPGRDRYFVLLTNRVFGGGTLEEMRSVRRAFHDALADV
jgi:CubicO group peptidase (beta-lactamase class C family)